MRHLVPVVLAASLSACSSPPAAPDAGAPDAAFAAFTDAGAPPDAALGPRVFVAEGAGEATLLRLLPLAFEGGELTSPVLVVERADRALVDDFLAAFAGSTSIAIDDSTAGPYLEAHLRAAAEAVLAPSAPRSALVAAAVYAASFGLPLVVDPPESASFAGKKCLAFDAALSGKGCAPLTRADPEALGELLRDRHRAEGLEPTYLLLMGADDPQAAAAVYLAARRAALPFFVDPAAAPADTAAAVKARALALGLRPAHLAVFGLADRVPSRFHPGDPTGQGAVSFYDDADYAQLDDDQLPDLLYGRLATLDLQDAFTVLNRVFHYGRLSAPSRAKVDIHYCDTDLVPGSGDCAADETAATVCAVKGYLESRGFAVREFRNEAMSRAGFLDSLTAAGHVLKHSHGSSTGTLLRGEEFLWSDFPAMRQLPTYSTASCYTANFPGVGDQSFMLQFFRHGGVGYLGASALGQPLPAQVAWMTRGLEQSRLLYTGLGAHGGLGAGVDYHGDPAFNPGFPAPTGPGVTSAISKVADHVYRLAVSAPADATSYFCNGGLFASGIDRYVTQMNGTYTYGVHLVRQPVDRADNVLVSARLVDTTFDPPGVVQDPCPTPDKEHIDTYVCSQIVDSGLVIQLGGVGERVELFGCQVDEDVFEDRTYLACQVSTPYAPVDLARTAISKLVGYTVEVTLRHSDVPCEKRKGVCLPLSEPCGGPYHEASTAQGCPDPGGGVHCCASSDMTVE